MFFRKHEAAPDAPAGYRLRKKWSRKRKLATATVALMTSAALAWAAITVFRPIQGGGNVVAATNIEFVSVTEVADSNGENKLVDCAVTASTPVSATLRMDNADAGAWCEFAFSVRAIGRAANLVVQDLNFAALTTEGFVGSACGQGIPRAPAAPGVYTVRITIPDNATEQSFEVEPGAGFYAADFPGNYVDANCPRHNGGA